MFSLPMSKWFAYCVTIAEMTASAFVTTVAFVRGPSPCHYDYSDDYCYAENPDSPELRRWRKKSKIPGYVNSPMNRLLLVIGVWVCAVGIIVQMFLFLKTLFVEL